MSTSREIQIEDRYGSVMHVADVDGMIDVLVMLADDRETVEIDETDRRDLADFLNGAR